MMFQYEGLKIVDKEHIAHYNKLKEEEEEL
jgi:hypothetical protein